MTYIVSSYPNLLIFYMVTTVFSMPQAMEVNLPPKSEEEQKLKIKQSNVLTLLVDADDNMYYYIGQDLPTPMRTDSLRTLLVDKNKENAKLNTLLIINQEARYKSMVDILDEIDLIERSFNTNTAKEMGVTLKEFNDPKHDRYDEFKNKKFSYRYAMIPWEERYGRMIARVMGTEGE